MSIKQIKKSVADEFSSVNTADFREKSELKQQIKSATHPDNLLEKIAFKIKFNSEYVDFKKNRREHFTSLAKGASNFTEDKKDLKNKFVSDNLPGSADKKVARELKNAFDEGYGQYVHENFSSLPTPTSRDFRLENRRINNDITKSTKKYLEDARALTSDEAKAKAKETLDENVEGLRVKIEENKKAIKQDSTQVVTEEVKDIAVGVASAYGVPAFAIQTPWDIAQAGGIPLSPFLFPIKESFPVRAGGQLLKSAAKPFGDLYFNDFTERTSDLTLGQARLVGAINFASENLPLVPSLLGRDASWTSVIPQKFLAGSANLATVALAVPTLLTPPPEFHAFIGAMEANELLLSRSDWSSGDRIVFAAFGGVSLLLNLNPTEEAIKDITNEAIADECTSDQLNPDAAEGDEDPSLTNCGDGKANDGMGEPMIDGVFVYIVDGLRKAKAALDARRIGYSLSGLNGVGRILGSVAGGGSRYAYDLAQNVINLSGAAEADRITINDIKKANRKGTSLLDAGEVGLDVVFNPLGNTNALSMERGYSLGDYRREAGLETYSRWNALLPHLDSSGATAAGFAGTMGNRVFSASMLGVRTQQAMQGATDQSQKTYIVVRTVYDFGEPILRNKIENGEDVPWVLVGSEALGMLGGAFMASKRPDLFAFNDLSYTGNGLVYNYEGKKFGDGTFALSGDPLSKSASLVWSGEF